MDMGQDEVGARGHSMYTRSAYFKRFHAHRVQYYASDVCIAMWHPIYAS